MEKTKIKRQTDLYKERCRKKFEAEHLKNIRILEVEKNSNQLILLLFLNIIVLLFINYSLENNKINIIISYNIFYTVIFALIIAIGFIYGIIKRKMVIDIIFYSKVFLFLNIIFLIYIYRYIYFLHISIPYANLIKVFDLIEVNHVISLDFAIYCSKEYCLRFELFMLKEEDILNICNTTLDFNLIVEKLEMRNEDLIKEFLAREKFEAEQKTLLYKIKKISSYIPAISNVFFILSSYAHTPMFHFNFLNTIDVILSQGNFPKEIFDDYEGLFYFLFPQLDEEALDFPARLV